MTAGAPAAGLGEALPGPGRAGITAAARAVLPAGGHRDAGHAAAGHPASPAEKGER
jgi:hypothetical protein